MRHLTTIAVLGLGVCVSACSETEPAAAPVTAAPASTTNAGPEYRRLHAALGPAFFAGLDGADAGASRLVRQQPVVAEIVSATRRPQCTFDVDWSEGLNVLLPHLAELRRLSKTLRADALRLAEAGDGAAAAERVAAMVRMSRHTAGEQILLSKLVAFSILDDVAATVTRLTDRDQLDAGARRVILAELEKIDGGDPLDAMAGLAGEREVTVSAVRENRGVKELVGPAWDHVPADEHPAVAIALDSVFRDMERAWGQNAAVTRLTGIEAAVSDERVQMILPRISAYRRQVDTVSRRLREAIDRLG